MDLQEFTERFRQIKKKGFIPSLRKGATGIGFTLETELGIVENNLAVSDFPSIELKAHRSKNASLITLFTFNRKAWRMKPLDAIRKYGSRDRDGRLGLYYTMSMKANSAGLFLHVSNDDAHISVQHISGDVLAEWNLENLAKRFQAKIPSLIFVTAFSELRDGIEYFHFFRAQLMQGTSAELLANQFRDETIVLDLRLHDQSTRARNHGTAFRAYEHKLPLLFKHIEEIE